MWRASLNADPEASSPLLAPRTLDDLVGAPRNARTGSGADADGNGDSSGEGDSNKKRERPPRLASIDVARGGTLAVMILVNYAPVSTPSWWPHALWDGLNLSDVVMPAFLFLVGVSVALSLAQLRGKGTATPGLLSKVVERTIKLFLLGLISGSLRTAPDSRQPWPYVDLDWIRIMGVLQRIAVVYFVTATAFLLCPPVTTWPRLTGWLRLLDVPMKYAVLWVVGVLFALGYLLVFFLVYVPDYEVSAGPVTYTYQCSCRAATNPTCNPFDYSDTTLFGAQHVFIQLPWPHEPESLSSTLMAVGSGFAGLFFGLILFHFREETWRVGQWTAASVLMAGVGMLIHFFTPLVVNKKMYTPSYMLVNAAISGGCLAAIYLLVDSAFAHQRLAWLRWVLLPFTVLGMNSIVIYVASSILPSLLSLVYYQDPSQNAVEELYEIILSPWAGTDEWYIGQHLWALMWLAIYTLFAGYLYHRKIFFKV